MKRITIPERFGYPTLEITINGKEQTFNSGVEIEVEDSVAEAIENAIALEPKQGRNISKLAQFVEGKFSKLTAIDLDGAEGISDFAFYKCLSLTDVTISSSIKTIGWCAFFGCTNILSIKFEDDSKIDNIGISAFEWCDKMKSFFLPVNPPTLADVNAFANINKNCVFYCKTQASLDAYKAAENWSTLTGTYTFKVEE